MDTLLQKPGTSRARVFVLLISTTIMLFGVCPTLFAQTPTANLNDNHLRRELTPEDVYFNADGRQVSSTTSLSATQMSATTVSILIFAERRNAKGAVLVDIDGLDIDAR